MRFAFFAGLIFVACGGNTTAPAPDAPVSSASPSVDAGSPSKLSIGTTCATPSDCGASSSLCFKTSFGVEVPGGYCSARCAAQADCGTDPKVICGTPKGSDNPGTPDSCLQRCDPKAGTPVCRQGLVCRPLLHNGQDSNDFACWVPVPG